MIIESPFAYILHVSSYVILVMVHESPVAVLVHVPLSSLWLWGVIAASRSYICAAISSVSICLMLILNIVLQKLVKAVLQLPAINVWRRWRSLFSHCHNDNIWLLY